MKVLYILTLVCMFANCRAAGSEEVFSPLTGRSPKPDELVIGPTAVIMPLGRFVLVRKGAEYCAVKFTETWQGATKDDQYADYESYYQTDGSGELTKESVKVTKERLVRRHYWGVGKLSFAVGRQNLDVKCGPIRMAWLGRGSLHFFATGESDVDQGIELAPTEWTDISQVNVFDPRLKWYRYDEKRKDIYIPIDQLWEDKEDRK